MPKNSTYKQHKRGKEQFVVIYNFRADTIAWMSLKPGPKALYLELKRQYNGHNNGRVLLSYRDAAVRLSCSNNTVGSWFKQLEARGFVVCMQRHHLGPSGVGQTSHWRLAEYSCDGKHATHDYRTWVPVDKIKTLPNISHKVCAEL